MSRFIWAAGRGFLVAYRLSSFTRRCPDGPYNSFFQMFDRSTQREETLEASRDNSRPQASLQPHRVGAGRQRKGEVSAGSLDQQEDPAHAGTRPRVSSPWPPPASHLGTFRDEVSYGSRGPRVCRIAPARCRSAGGHSPHRSRDGLLPQRRLLGVPSGDPGFCSGEGSPGCRCSGEKLAGSGVTGRPREAVTNVDVFI